MEKEKEEIKRIQIRLSKTNYQKMEHMAERYGMTINSLCNYAIGIWLDHNYDIRDRMLDKMVEMMSSEDSISQLFSNPAFSAVFSESIKSAMSQGMEESRENT